MKYTYKWVKGNFVNRPNRFIAYVEVNGEVVKCHVPNTGRCKELLTPDAKVLLSCHFEEERKTDYSLRMVMRNGTWVSIDSQIPNALVEEGIKTGIIKELSNYSIIKRESTYKNSRFDFRLEGEDVCFVEVKGVTLERNNWGYFPDAPTERGRKHIEELCHAVHEGYRGVIIFLIQHTHINGLSPNKETDPKFSEALLKAKEMGVEILAYGCRINEEEIVINQKLPVEL